MFRYKKGEISWKTFRKYMSPVRRKIDALLLRGKFSGNKRLVGMCSELYKHRQWLWTFVDVHGIEPTNNTAERALRPAVIYRKLSFGTQSESGRVSSAGDVRGQLRARTAHGGARRALYPTVPSRLGSTLQPAQRSAPAMPRRRSTDWCGSLGELWPRVES